MEPPIKNLILDMDGVLWRGMTPMPGLVDFFNALDTAGIGFVLATNNATKTAVMYSEKLSRFGVTVPPAQILTSAEATAAYLAEQYEPGASMYVVGAQGLHDAMLEQGFQIVTPIDARAGIKTAAVVAGMSSNVTYEDLAMASLLVSRGVPFFGTNPDVSFPTEIGPLPGAGAFLAVITTATGVEPTIIGKPGPILFHEAVKRLGGDAAGVVMVGDRLSTDIYGAKAAGLRAILLLSGISTREEAEAGSVQPDFIFADITELASFLTREAVVAKA